ncbi:MAG: DNA polymerase III subunit gamma/tau, partial [Proteobacteria bacterium]|nr:DNA polymerase III subunit gamma/tau [Pseudomonadota bacterium]
ELDAASNTQVDNMRDLLETAAYKPTVGEYKIFIIDEVHMLSRSAFNAMLKTLEEPPEHVKFILATTDPQKVPVTVLSRCLQFNLKPIPVPIIEEQMKKILRDENIEFDSQGIELLSRYARGSLRDGLSLLDQSIAQGNGKVEEESVKSMLGVVDESLVQDLVEITLNQDADLLTQKIGEIERMGASFAFVLDEMASLLQRLSLFSLTTQGLDERLIEGYQRLVDQTDEEHLQLLYQIVTVGKRDLPLAPDEKVGFTMVLLRMMAFLPDHGLDREPQKKKVVAKMVPISNPLNNQKVETKADANSQLPVVLKTNADWKAFVLEKVSSGMAKMLADNAEFESFGEGVLKLSLDGDQKHLMEDRYRGKLQELIREHIDAKCRLEIKVGVVSDTPLANEQIEKKKRLDQISRDLEKDPFVKSLKENLGGKLVTESIRSTK